MSKHGNSNARRTASATGPGDLGIAGLIALFSRRKLLFIFLMAAAALSVSVIHFWLPVYEARTALVFQTASSNPVQALSAHMASMGMPEDENREMERYVTRLNSPGFFGQVVTELRKMDVDLAMFHKEMLSNKRRFVWELGRLLHLPVNGSSMKDMDDDDMATVLAGGVYFTVGGVDRINIVVRNGDRASASMIVNVVADAAVKMLLSEGLRDLEDARTYVERQAKDIEAVIHEIGDHLSRLKMAQGITSDDGGGSASVQAGEIRRMLNDANLQLDENARRIAKLEEDLAEESRKNHAGYSAETDPENRYGIPHKIAVLKRANEQISVRQSALKQMLSGIIKSASIGDGERVFELRKRMEFEYSIYEELKKQAFQLEMRRIGANNKVHAADRVREGGAQRTDNLLTKLAIALILSVFCGLPIAIIWEMAWPGVRSGRDLADAGLAYLGGVPLVSGRFSMDKRAHGPRICRFDSDSEVAMAFIQIRSRLLYLSDRKDTRSQAIAVVSASPGEGKSFFSRSLAACFGHMGRKTLLIDCDLRKAMTTEYFDLLEMPGIGEVLTGERKFGDVVQREVIKGVDFVGSGMFKTNITDLFADGALGTLLRDLREVYDHIVLDTPSLLAVPDAPMIARAADLPLLLAAMNTTTKNDLEVSLDRIHALYSGEVYAALNRVTGGQVPLYLVPNGRRAGGGTSNIFAGPQSGGGAEIS
jgi:capsular exopolysaccharide synthesis family protein